METSQGMPTAAVVVEHIEKENLESESLGENEKSLSQLGNDWQDHNNE